jgi:hypothetical protein
MPGRSRFIATRRLATLVMTVSLLGGCSTWRMQGLAPATAISATSTPPHVRITLRDETRFEVYQAVVQGDSLLGVGPAAPLRAYNYGRPVAPTLSHARIAVALSDIRTLEIRTHSGGKTTLLVTGIIVGLLAVFVVGLAASGSFEVP